MNEINGLVSLKADKVTGGFSLVEVALAIGICSFCLVSILGLLPVGIDANRDAIEQTTAAGIARAVAGDFWSLAKGDVKTPIFKIDVSSGASSSGDPAATLFLTEEGSVTNVSSARYRLDVDYGATSASGQVASVRILISWPAGANPTVGVWPNRMPGHYQVMTEFSLP